MAKKTVRRWDPATKTYYETTEGTDEGLETKAKVQDVSGLAQAAEAKKKATPAPAEEDPTKMSPLQRAAYENKKKKQKLSTESQINALSK